MSGIAKRGIFFYAEWRAENVQGHQRVEAYIGTPIFSPITGQIIGHIAATNPNPVAEEKKSDIDPNDICSTYWCRV